MDTSIFSVTGPVMIGPSSSHTAGACRLARVAREIIISPFTHVSFGLHGSFARTYKGHGTDRALLAGVMGCSTDDERIPKAYEMAEEQGLAWHFSRNETETEVYPNTVDISLTGVKGKKISLRGESVGGGKIRIARIDGIEVDFTGEYNTLIIVHKDKVGMAAHITRVLSEERVNIAFMRLFREAKGDTAYSIVEFDGELPQNTQQKILEKQDVENVMVIDVKEEI